MIIAPQNIVLSNGILHTSGYLADLSIGTCPVSVSVDNPSLIGRLQSGETRRVSWVRASIINEGEKCIAVFKPSSYLAANVASEFRISF